jgi:hypothetical protein
MTQSKATYFSTATQVQFPADQFGVLDVDASYTTAPGDKFFVGEKITGGTSGCTARVSGFISATKIRVKGLKPGTSALIFAQGETVTGNKSSATAVVGAATLVLAQQRKRDIGSGTPTLVFENRAAITDRGFETQYWNPVTNADGRTNIAPGKNPLKYTSVVTAIRTAASKAQNTDTSVAPTLTYFGPPATSAAVIYSLAAQPTLQFHISSSEVFTLTGGAPRISFSLSGAGTSIASAGITSINGSGTVATIVFVAAPGWRVGHVFAVATMTTAGFNNAAAVVTSVSADGKTVTYANVTSGACTVGSGTVRLNALQYADIDLVGSTNRDLYFNYDFAGGEPTGALSNTTAYVANGATFTDVGGGAFVLAPNGLWSPALSGVTVVA